jgi:D-alanyl-D-alanine carboxypeptidase (penicillin-binding protein 5/6)
LPRPPLGRAVAALLALGAALALAALPARAIETSARAAIVVDATSGATLFEKNAAEPLPPASMSKLMTLYMVFDAIRAGRLSLEDRLPVSEAAWRMGGSKMFVHVGDSIRVEDLLHGVTVQSGNDACVVLAEALSGSEAAFAAAMNDKAREIGLTDSSFRNATGWPEEGHLMSVRDLARLAGRIVAEFPDLYRLFSVREFTWENITQQNRNPLLYVEGFGADGMKTGHTSEAGYGLVASVKRGERRVIAVIAGTDGPTVRRQEAETLVNWAFREFRTGVLYAAGTPVAEAPVWIGAAETVGLAPAADIVATVPVAAAQGIRARARFDGPVPAPIARGQTLGALVVEAPGVGAVTYPLVAVADVAEGGVMARLGALATLAFAPAPPPAPATE